MASRLMFAALLIGFVVGADAPNADAVKEEMKKLEGTWTVESATKDGKPLEKQKGGQFIFAADKLTIKSADGKMEKMTYKVDPSAKPRTMDFVPEEKKPNTATGHAIYELDGDSLKLCLGPPGRRPKEFSDQGQVLFLLKRKK